MEKGPLKKMSYEQALAFAKSKLRTPDAWAAKQLLTLEAHLIKMANEKLKSLHFKKRQSFNEELRELVQSEKYDLVHLTALGNKYEILDNFDLERETLKSFCETWNIDLTS